MVEYNKELKKISFQYCKSLDYHALIEYYKPINAERPLTATLHMHQEKDLNCA